MITDLNAWVVTYMSAQGMCTATNVTYKRDGHQMSARLPWVASPSEARAWLEARR